MREQLLAAEKVTAIAWRDGALYLLDQRLLPHEETWHRYDSAAAVADAIRQMVVRGAPAIGISAAYGVVLGARARLAEGGDWRTTLAADVRVLAESRPTAVNLFWALDRMKACLARIAPDTANDDVLRHLEAEAIAVHNQDREANLTMAELGLALIRQHANHPQKLLTHCNTGALATGGFGTALGVIRAAHAAGLVDCVFADETRPWLQGARLTAWELAGECIPVRLNADAAAAHLMKTEGITWVIVGADRITANGDVANKIGTYQLAVTARYHGVRFMVVAPSSTIDMSLDNGNAIPIEERTGRELLEIGGQRVAAAVEAVNPVFDVTPAELIDAIVTERGVVQHPTREQMQSLMRD